MKLRDKYFPSREPVSVSSAFVLENIPDGKEDEYYSDPAAFAAIDRIGDLLEILNDKDVLSDNDILQLLGRRWAVA